METPNTERPVYSVFKEEKNLVESKICPICLHPINEEDFKDNLSRKEYQISGMCQACQDNMFG